MYNQHLLHQTLAVHTQREGAAKKFKDNYIQMITVVNLHLTKKKARATAEHTSCNTNEWT